MIPRAFVWLALSVVAAGRAEEAADPHAQIQSDFEKRVGDYVKIHKTAQEGLDKLKPTKSAGTIGNQEDALAHQIRELRRNARQGDIFTTPIAVEFRRLIGITLQAESTRIEKSLRRAEPVRLAALRVNRKYPEGVPLQSTPPTLLLNLPKLPAEVDYRVVGRALVLRDVEANLIIDFVPDALPARTHAP